MIRKETVKFRMSYLGKLIHLVIIYHMLITWMIGLFLNKASRNRILDQEENITRYIVFHIFHAGLMVRMIQVALGYHWLDLIV